MLWLNYFFTYFISINLIVFAILQYIFVDDTRTHTHKLRVNESKRVKSDCRLFAPFREGIVCDLKHIYFIETKALMQFSFHALSIETSVFAKRLLKLIKCTFEGFVLSCWNEWKGKAVNDAANHRWNGTVRSLKEKLLEKTKEKLCFTRELVVNWKVSKRQYFTSLSLNLHLLTIQFKHRRLFDSETRCFTELKAQCVVLPRLKPKTRNNSTTKKELFFSLLLPKP